MDSLNKSHLEDDDEDDDDDCSCKYETWGTIPIYNYEEKIVEKKIKDVKSKC